MKNKLLFPSRFRIIGIVLLILSTILLIAWLKYDFTFSFLQFKPIPPSLNFANLFEDNNLTNELIGTGLLLGLIFIAFAKEPIEDERKQMLRLQSLQISHYLNYLLFAILLFSVNGVSFLGMMLFLPYVFLITFIIVYYFRLHLLPKFAQHEK
jgi:hypothetical protein